jgi:hypothetical protein
MEKIIILIWKKRPAVRAIILKSLSSATFRYTIPRFAPSIWKANNELSVPEPYSSV